MKNIKKENLVVNPEQKILADKALVTMQVVELGRASSLTLGHGGSKNDEVRKPRIRGFNEPYSKWK